MNTEEDEIIARLRQDFLDDTVDRIDQIEVNIDRVASALMDPAEGIPAIRRDAHTIKGLGRSFGFPAIGVIAHRLEDFLAGMKTISDEQAAALVDFTSWIREIVDRGENPPEQEEQKILRSLPTRVADEFKAVKKKDVEILIVTATAVQARFLERELHGAGIKVIKAHSGVQAFEMAVHCKPDAVISAAVLEGLSGIDLIKALSAMSETEGKPLALLTSFGRDHAELRTLPQTVDVIHNDGARFAKDCVGFITKVIGPTA